MDSMSAIFGVRYEGDRAWVDVCDDNGVHSVALDAHDAIATGRALLDFGERVLAGTAACSLANEEGARR